MFDVKQAEKDAKAEIAKETAERAKGKIKEHLKRLAAARQVVVNLEREYAVMLAEIGAE